MSDQELQAQSDEDVEGQKKHLAEDDAEGQKEGEEATWPRTTPKARRSITWLRTTPKARRSILAEDDVEGQKKHSG